MIVLLFVAAHWYLSLFTQTFFHHRYAAHQQFTMSKGWERFWFFLSWIFQGSSYLSPYVYGALHRMHHAYADTEKDPHSPKYDRNVFTMMWRTKVLFSAIQDGEMEVEQKFKKDLPEWHSFDHFANVWPTRLAWVGVYIAIYLLWAPTWGLIMIPLHAVMGPFHGAVINWFAHKFGYAAHEVNDTSKNLLPVDFLMLGESYHNNHHKYPARSNFGMKWYELDPVYPFILLFNATGMIKLRRPHQTVKKTAKAKMQTPAPAAKPVVPVTPSTDSVRA